MCAIFGFVNYGHALSRKNLKELTRRISVESEVRGKDASGIAYVRNGELIVFKRPKPAHKVRFYFPDDTTILMGHTRMTTQGNAKFNYNNHPFTGKTADGNFALCHNGVIYNDKDLSKTEKLPSTKIQTDSYVAVQLIEKYGKLNFDTIAKMCETVSGNFTFTMLNEDSTLYLAKGDNPLCLVHFKQLGLYVYTSTTNIMSEVIKGSFLERYKFDIIEVQEGDIIRIDEKGVLTKDSFTFDIGFGFYNYYRSYGYDTDCQYGYLYEMCGMFGLAPEDMELLYDMGYTDDEIEMMLDDRQYLHMCLDEARALVGERL